MSHGVTSTAPIHSATEEKDKTPRQERTRSGSGSSGHKRSLSGNLFMKLPFLKPSQGRNDGPDLIATTDGVYDAADVLPGTGGSMAAAVEQKKTRKRKGSLRKTALLGTGVLRPDSKEKRNKPSASPPGSPLASLETPDSSKLAFVPSPVSPETDVNPKPSYDRPEPPIRPTTKPSLPLIQSRLRSDEDPGSVMSVTSPTLGEASTTDDEDSASFPSLPITMPKKTPSSSSDSYFPLQHESLSRKSLSLSSRVKSPLATQSVDISPVPDEWDYSETEWWGWIILIVTWIVFVVGMGSCLGVWSWAWDVGETPYAPPELEDDPTLPIVGYYPALIILTAVMAWVWVVVAWVGMKYFKHANISGEDV